MSNETERRWLLVRKASEIMPLDVAFDLAQKVESFIVFGLGLQQPSSGPSGFLSVQGVIQYLREQGEEVVADGTGFRLNSQIVTFAVIVQRANQLRQAQGLPPFCFYTHHGPSEDPPPDHNTGHSQPG